MSGGAGRAPSVIERLDPAREEDVKTVIDVLREGFSYNDPYSWSRALSMPPQGFGFYMMGYVPKCASEILGCLVTRSESIDGVLALEDFSSTSRKPETNVSLD